MLIEPTYWLRTNQIDEGIVTLERAFAVEPRADVAFSYGNALVSRSKGKDLEISIQVLTGIDLSSVVPPMRHGICCRPVPERDRAASDSGIDPLLAWLSCPQPRRIQESGNFTGEFSGSPVEQDHTFKLSNNKIASLEIR